MTKCGGTSVGTPTAWSPDGKWISFRRTDERYWSNRERMLKIYSEKPADKRPVWVIRPDGSEALALVAPALPVCHRWQRRLVETDDEMKELRFAIIGTPLQFTICRSVACQFNRTKSALNVGSSGLSFSGCPWLVRMPRTRTRDGISGHPTSTLNSMVCMDKKKRLRFQS